MSIVANEGSETVRRSFGGFDLDRQGGLEVLDAVNFGDERNYAGTSFVTMDRFGSSRYGSDLHDITFDPTIQDEFATYAYDDEARARSADRGLPLQSVVAVCAGLPGLRTSGA